MIARLLVGIVCRPCATDRRPVAIARVAAVALLALALCAACGAGPTASPGPIGPASPAAVASGAPTSPADGLLVDIDAKGLGDVAGFSLRLADGREVRFRLGDLENPVDFPPGHLAEHLATASPIRVWFHAEGPDLVVYRIEDAP